MKNKEKEYERLSSEILQDQQIRITIFTFSITTTAAIIGFSSQMIPSSGGSESGILSIIVFAIYAILIPSIILARLRLRLPRKKKGRVQVEGTR
jgi:hypothetical protein